MRTFRKPCGGTLLPLHMPKVQSLVVKLSCSHIVDVEAKLKKEKRKLKEETLWRDPPDKELRPADAKLPSTNLSAMWAILKADPQTPVRVSVNCSPSQKKKKTPPVKLHQLNWLLDLQKLWDKFLLLF